MKSVIARKEILVAIFSLLLISTICRADLAKGNVTSYDQPGKGSISLDLMVDEDSSVYTETKLVTLENLDAAELEPFVRKSLSKYGSVSVNSSANMLVITDKEPKLSDIVLFVLRMDELGSENFVQLETRIIPLANVQASYIRDIISTRLSSDGTATADDNLNVLVVTDVSGKIDYIIDIVEQLDMPPAQIVFDIRVLMLFDTDFSDIGIDLNDIINRTTVSFKKSELDYSVESYVDRDEKTLTFGMSDDTSDIIDLMESAGKAKLISDSRLVTINNVQGSLYVSKLDMYNTSYYSRAQLIDGVKISVLPRVGTGDLMKVSFTASTGLLEAIAPESENLNVSEMAPAALISSTFMVNDGETFVVGGLESINERKLKRHSPIIGKLPILGEIFTKKSNVYEKEQLLIFVTPHIVDAGKDASKASDAQYFAN